MFFHPAAAAPAGHLRRMPVKKKRPRTDEKDIVSENQMNCGHKWPGNGTNLRKNLMTTISQIKVGKHQSGIVDLDVALRETAKQGTHLSDQQIAAMLVEKISKKNYIPPNVTHLYEAALLREYKKYIGETVPEEPRIAWKSKSWEPAAPIVKNWNRT
jgi:hypothetical protein